MPPLDTRPTTTSDDSDDDFDDVDPEFEDHVDAAEPGMVTILTHCCYKLGCHI